MERDAFRMAVVVMQDMGLHPDRLDFDWCAFLADQHGGDWHWAESEYIGCCCGDTGKIWLHKRLVPGAACEVLIHELAHRFMFSERYADLHNPAWNDYDPHDFRELVALMTGLYFRFMGGTGPDIDHFRIIRKGKA